MSNNASHTAALKEIGEIERLRAEVETLQRRVEALDALAHQDPLVAMPNRRGFLRELDRLIAHVTRYGNEAAMLYVDLDGLKSINDSFGHRAGDEALIQVASLLAAGIRDSDSVARIGGDEFAILLENTDEANARETAERLGNCVCECEFRHEREELPLSVTIGVAMIARGCSSDEVMDRADADMYRARAEAAA